MSEYINKQQAIDLMESMISERGHVFNPYKLVMVINDFEGVEIVRCKDCKWYECGGLPCPLDVCEALGDDGFCSRGEKQVTGKLSNPDNSLLTEKSEVVDTYIAGVVFGYNRGVKDCERVLQLSPETSTKTSKTSTNEVDTPTNTPTNTPTDLISRQAVTDLLLDAQDGSGQTYEVLRELLHEVAFMPPVEPTLKDLKKPNKSCEVENVEPKSVMDAISKHDLWRIIEDNAYWITYNETSREKGMTLTGINQALNECPPVQPERPKGEWVDREHCQVDEDAYEMAICSNCKAEITLEDSYDNFCPNCGCDCRGDKE